VLHDTRLRIALASLRLKAWPFPGPVGIRERGPMGEGSVLHVVDQWRHLGTAANDAEVAALIERRADVAFDPDGYRIIARCLERLNARDLVMLDGGRR
jgi:DNA polymerase-3 subunit epsilon